ncbi:MAG: PEP-CTERM sorting domain-containing protein [Verrucomicrobia bacterium]|nr:MAG: PEP-CTERM sorting domain-containing protein [Verrucomicrobiota bacterium]
MSITGSLSFDGFSYTGQNNDYFDLASPVHNIQTVAMVFRKTSNNYYGGDVCMFGSDPTGWVNEAFNGDNHYGTTYFSYDISDPAVRYGDIRINGSSVGAGNGGYTSVPTDYHIMVFQIQQGWGSDININQIASATDHNSLVWGMDVAELLVYDTFLNHTEVGQVESYLNNRYFVVPEPTSASLVGLGVAAFFVARRKQNK